MCKVVAFRMSWVPFYSGQAVKFQFIIPILFENILVKIEEWPESPCSTSNKSTLAELDRDVCTSINYVIQHKSGENCDLYLKAIPSWILHYPTINTDENVLYRASSLSNKFYT